MTESEFDMLCSTVSADSSPSGLTVAQYIASVYLSRVSTGTPEFASIMKDVAIEDINNCVKRGIDQEPATQHFTRGQ